MKKPACYFYINTVVSNQNSFAVGTLAWRKGICASPNSQPAVGHTFLEAKDLRLYYQLAASNRRGIQPATAADSAQPMPVSNQSLFQATLFSANFRKS